jgi:hypothetical protein
VKEFVFTAISIGYKPLTNFGKNYFEKYERKTINWKNQKNQKHVLVAAADLLVKNCSFYRTIVISVKQMMGMRNTRKTTALLGEEKDKIREQNRNIRF